jgi:hypothetical protein
MVDAILIAKKDNPVPIPLPLRANHHLVYRLYDLTEEEIRIVEKNG